MSTANPGLEERIARLDKAIEHMPPRPAQGGHAAMAGIRRATALACMVRDEDATGIGAYLDDLDRAQLYGLVVALAAMVPDDQPVDDLLRWLEPIGRQLENDAERARATARRQAAA